MRRTIGVTCAFIMLMTLAGVTSATAQQVTQISLNASPSIFTPGEDWISLNVSASWYTNSDCQFWLGHSCDVTDARIEIWGSNGFYDVRWVPFPDNGWENWFTSDPNPGNNTVTYQARVTVWWDTLWWGDSRDAWATVYPDTGPPFGYFYEHIDYGGNTLAAQYDTPYVGDTMNDEITAVRVPVGKTVVLYQHSNYGGASLTLTSDTPDLRVYAGPGTNGTWNDCVSSFRIF